MYENLDHLFTLRVKLRRDKPTIAIRAYDANHVSSTGHSRIDVDVRMGGVTIFPRGSTWCGMSRGSVLDGIEARELVLSLVAMRPGDTDPEYFSGYTPEQLAFAEEYGEELSLEAQIRYCDKNGNVKRRR